MAQTPTAADPLGDARAALFAAARKADRLAKSVEELETRYANAENPNPGYFYVPTDLDKTWGRTLDPEWTDHAPASERRPRRTAIDATLALRTAVDAAMDAVLGIAAYMDSEAQSVDQRWTTRTIGHLRKLRGAILCGHGNDVFPSALPMIRAGVPEALREQALHVIDRMEEVKSAIVAGAKPPAPPAAGVESAGPALTVNQSRVLQTMARFDASCLLSSKMIAEEMDATVRLSEETVRLCVGKLIKSNLAERPEGDRSGARLTPAGRKLAGKIAD